MALVDDSTFYIRAYFEETKLPRIRVGDAVKVWLMGAGEPMQGHVESISRVSPTATATRTASCCRRLSQPSTGCVWRSAYR